MLKKILALITIIVATFAIGCSPVVKNESTPYTYKATEIIECEIANKYCDTSLCYVENGNVSESYVFEIIIDDVSYEVVVSKKEYESITPPCKAVVKIERCKNSDLIGITYIGNIIAE